jgi:hypothetical protein
VTTAPTPLLVTGLARTGTSWVGKMVEAGGDVVYINEPMNPSHPPGRSPGVFDTEVAFQYQYISAENEHRFLDAYRKTLALKYGFVRELRRNRKAYDLARMAKYGTTFTVGRLTGKRPMLDDPFAVFAVPWLTTRLGVRAVVLVRDPVALVGSYRKLNWRMKFDQLLDQKDLVRDLLHPEDVADMAAHQPHSDSDRVGAAAIKWRTVYRAVDEHYRTLPAVAIRRYEDFARQPLESFEELYDFFGLKFGAKARQRIVEATTGGGTDQDSHKWSVRGGLSKTAFRPMDSASMLTSAQRRLTQDEIATVRRITGSVAARFGY